MPGPRAVPGLGFHHGDSKSVRSTDSGGRPDRLLRELHAVPSASRLLSRAVLTPAGQGLLCHFTDGHTEAQRDKRFSGGHAPWFAQVWSCLRLLSV